MNIYENKYGTLYNADCFDVFAKIPDGSVDMVLCDLPYGMTARCDWDIPLPLNLLWREYWRVCKANAAIVLFGMMPYGAEVIMSNKKNFRYEIIWEKSCAVGFLNARRMPMRAHENILVFYKRLPTYNPQKNIATKRRTAKRRGGGQVNTLVYGSRNPQPDWIDGGTRFPRDVICFPSPHHRLGHPTEKPIDLLSWLIRTYTNEGETVMDNCIGTGSTAVAAITCGRRFIGIEKKEEFYQTATQRVELAVSFR